LKKDFSNTILSGLGFRRRKETSPKPLQAAKKIACITTSLDPAMLIAATLTPVKSIIMPPSRPRFSKPVWLVKYPMQLGKPIPKEELRIIPSAVTLKTSALLTISDVKGTAIPISIQIEMNFFLLPNRLVR
jgi:hypothetical protein